MTSALQFQTTQTLDAPFVDAETNLTETQTTTIATKAFANSPCVTSRQGIGKILYADAFQPVLEYLDPCTMKTLDFVNSHLTTFIQSGNPSLITMACLAQVETKNAYSRCLNEKIYESFRSLGICSFPYIQELHLVRPLTPEKLNEILACFQNLLSLNIEDAEYLTDASMAQISRFSNLKSLQLTNERISDKGLRFLATLPLVHLNLGGSKGLSAINDIGLKHIAKISSLECLHLFECSKISDQGVFELTGLSKLDTLNLIECNQTTNQAISYILQISSMRRLCLGGHFFNEEGQITENGLTIIARFPHVKLELASKMTGIDEDAVHRLRRLGIDVQQSK